MATPYTEVYEYFLSKISDYSFLNLTDQELEDDLRIYLRTSISNFDTAKSDLSNRDEILKQFSDDLSDKELDILSNLMVVAYLKSKLITSETYKLAMSDNDYKIYSQANHIKELSNLYKAMQTEADKMMTKFSYRNINLAEDLA